MCCRGHPLSEHIADDGSDGCWVAIGGLMLAASGAFVATACPCRQYEPFMGAVPSAGS